jgi:AAA domain
MPLAWKNTRDLIDPKNLKLKILIYGLPGLGKTSFVATAPNVAVGACETGHGKGLLSVATKGIRYAELNSFENFDEFCSAKNLPPEVETLALDSLTDMCKTFIKDKALTVPRSKGESEKRSMGVPENDDYGTMGELARKLTRKLLDQDKHIIATAQLRIKEPNEKDKGGETIAGPDLPGQMFLGSTGMFDLVLCLRHRTVFKNPAKPDPKEKSVERYFLTASQGQWLAKNRMSVGDSEISFLPPEIVYDIAKGSGTFNDILTRAQIAYAAFAKEKSNG